MKGVLISNLLILLQYYCTNEDNPIQSDEPDSKNETDILKFVCCTIVN